MKETIQSFNRILLYDEDKDALIDEILRLREENQKLRESLRKEKEQKKSLLEIAGLTKKKVRKRRKKPGRKKGHIGCTRHTPDAIDHIIHQTLEVCPDCGMSKLSELPSETVEHIQEDIVPVRVEATKFIRHGYWCPCCKKKVMAAYASEEIPYGYLGPNILIQTVLMKYYHGLPYHKIKELFFVFHGLKLTTSALAQALQRMSRWLTVEEDVIIEAVRSSPYIHMDETGWKIFGVNHWMWNAVNERLALYRIRRSRGRKVAKEILTTDYGGIVISDFLSAYDKSGRKRQRCLVHLYRDMKKYRELDKTEESQKAYAQLNRILKDAYRLDHIRSSLEPVIFLRRFHLIKERLFNFACNAFRSKHWQRISKRLLKHYEEILTFLEVPHLPSHNNHAERMIRPNIIFRKISYQNRSEDGARAHEVHMSLLQTLRLQNIDPVSTIKQAYLAHRKGNTAPVLAF